LNMRFHDGNLMAKSGFQLDDDAVTP